MRVGSNAVAATPVGCVTVAETCPTAERMSPSSIGDFASFHKVPLTETMQAPLSHVLLVDTDEACAKTLADLASEASFVVLNAATLREANTVLVHQRPPVALVNARLPDGEGLSLLKTARQTGTRIVLLSDAPTLEAKVEAARLGVLEYLQKPLDAHRLRTLLSADHHSPPLTASSDAPGIDRHGGHIGPLLGRSAHMQQLFDVIEKVAPTDVSIFITGESGTGKGLVAQTLHQFSRRAAGEFVPVNCGAISASLIESELFGHERGSFTGSTSRRRGCFECAHGGTIFFDEITEMPVELQAKVLRVIETGFVTRVGGVHRIPTDARIIAATSRNVDEAVAAGILREELLYRLNVFQLRLAPLRERKEDISQLAQHFLDLLNQGSKTAKVFAPGALERLTGHHWPGNVRELRNVVHRAFILADDVIGSEYLPDNAGTALHLTGDSLSIRIGTALAEAERRLILATLAQCRGNKRRAAEMLEISLKTLYNRLNTYRHN